MATVYTIDGTVTLDTTPFDSAIKKLVEKMEELKTGLSNLGINTQNFTNELSRADKNMSDIANNTTALAENIANVGYETQNLKSKSSEVTMEMEKQIETINILSNETSTLHYNFSQFTTDVEKAVGMVQQLTNEFTAMRFQLDSAMATAKGFEQLFEKFLLKEQEMNQRASHNLMSQMDIMHMRNQQDEADVSIQQDIIARLERQGQERKQNLELAKNELHYLEQQAEANRIIQEEIVAQLEVRGQLVTSIAEAIGLATEHNAIEERELAELDKQLSLRTEIIALTREGTAESLKQAEALIKQLDTDTEIYAVLREELTAEKERLGFIEKQNAELTKQASLEKETASVNKLDKMGNLPRRIGSMALTMWGFNEIMDVYDKTLSHINAESQKDYFADRLGMNTKALAKYNNELSKMQKDYEKLDMTVVGANALETASKYGVQEKSLGDLTEVMAIYGSEFVKQGRSQEDSILAVNDALDGELRRLKEVGIGAEELEATGLWSGDASDKEGMLKALKQIADERGYSQTAKDITNLSDAITTLEVKLSIDLARAFGVIEPLLRDVIKDFITMLETAEWLGTELTKLGTQLGKFFGLLDDKGNATKSGVALEQWGAWAITIGITLFGVYKIASKLLPVFGKISDIFKKTEKATGGVAKGTESMSGGFKDGFKGATKNIGKMAKVFLEVAVALAMAFVLIEEAILLISAIGYTYDSLKPQFEKGIEFIKEYGLIFALFGGALLGLSYLLKDVNPSTMAQVGKGALTVAEGIAIAMGLVAVAIGSLIMPLGAIILLGATANWQQGNLDKGIEVIQMMADALNSITPSVGVFLIAFGVASVILGYATPLAWGIAMGIVATLLLVAEAIVMLNAPLIAIASLGYMSDILGKDQIDKGAETIRLIGECLQVIASAIPSLLAVDIGMFSVALVEWGTSFITGGKDGLTYLADEIIPNLSSFVSKLNSMETLVPVDEAKISALVSVANQIPSIFNAINKVNMALGTTDAVGNIGGAIGGSISGAVGMGLKGKLDQLYNDARDIMDFATKMGTLQGSASSSAVEQVSQAVVSLNSALNTMVSTVNAKASALRGASVRLGSAIVSGFKQGSASFKATVVSTMAQAVQTIQSKYATFQSGGKALADKLDTGFKSGAKLKDTVSKELGYALAELDSKKDDFYKKGQMLGKSLHDGFVSEGGLDFHSPAKIARTIAQEMQYSIQALESGKALMYRGGQNLGLALASGYSSTGNIKTDISTLAKKGVSTSEITTSKQLSPQQRKKEAETRTINFNFDMSNARIYGIDDLERQMRESAEKVFYELNGSNGAIGY